MFNPNAPAGGWFTPGQGSVRPGASSTPNLDTPEGADQYAQQWQTYVEQLQQALAASSGFERRKLESELENAEKGRQNALAIARLSAETSRYGVDQQRKTALEQLKQRAYEFDQTHNLDMQKFGLNVAEAYTKYASTPDLTFQRADLMEGLNRAGVGLGPTPYGSQGTPQAKTWDDFQAILPYQQGQRPGATPGQSSSGGGFSTSPVRAGGMASTDANGDGIPDARQKAIKAITDAIPPSAAAGSDDSDFAALNAIRSVYAAARPGTLERMRPGQQAAFASGLSRLGYYAPDAIEDMRRSAPGQTSVRRA